MQQYIKECTLNRISVYTINEETRKFTERVYWLTVNDSEGLLKGREKTELLDAMVDGTFLKKIEKIRNRFNVEFKSRTEKKDFLSQEGYDMLAAEAMFDSLLPINIKSLNEYTFDCESERMVVTVTKRKPIEEITPRKLLRRLMKVKKDKR